MCLLQGKQYQIVFLRIERLQSGRHTLERTIAMVEADPHWRACVVYGDTDSLFVLLPGRSRVEAFRIGAEIAARATAANPPPVTLKMEKVESDTSPCSQTLVDGHRIFLKLDICATQDM